MNRIKVTKINDVECKKINLPKIDKGTIKGFDMIGGNLTPNIFVVGSSGSGKTSLLFNFIKNTCDKNTFIYFFVSTFFNDNSYDYIREYLEKKEIMYEGYEHIGSELKIFCETKGEEEKIRKEQEKEEILNKNNKNNIEDEKHFNTIDDVIRSIVLDENDNIKVRVRKPKKQAIKYLFVFDDVASDLRHKDVANFMKKRRHYGACNWIASQNLFDLDNHARNNVNIFILFGSLTEEKLIQFFRDANLSITYDKFIELYKYATAERYNFLYINKDSNTFRKNFNLKLEI